MAELNLYQKAVRSLALGEPDASTLSKPLLEQNPTRVAVFVSAVFIGMVERRFKDDHSSEAIASFMEDLRHSFRNAYPQLKPEAAEAMVKAVWDEDYPIDEIDTKDQHLSKLAVVREIVHELDDVRENLDSYLHDADVMTQSWLDSLSRSPLQKAPYLLSKRRPLLHYRHHTIVRRTSTATLRTDSEPELQKSREQAQLNRTG